MFPTGIRVRIHGLQSRYDLNGTIAVVLAPDNDEEAKDLQERGRIKVTGFPQTLSLKPTNLRALREDDPRDAAIDWTFCDSPPMGIKELLTSTEVGSHDRGDTLNDAILIAIRSGPGNPEDVEQLLNMPRRQISLPDHEMVSGFLNHHLHCVYFFRCDAISLYFTAETYCGKARVWQSFVKCAPGVGYTAKDWCRTAPKASWSDTLRAAHAHHGGGRELSRAEFEHAILQPLFDLQTYSDAVTESLKMQLPQTLLTQHAAWVKNFEAALARRAHGEDMGQSPLMAFTQRYINLIGCLTVYKVPGETITIATNDMANAMGVPDLSLSVPWSLAQPFLDTYALLIGCEPPSFVYMFMLHYADWRLLGRGGMRCGWAYSAATIPHEAPPPPP